MSWRISLGRRVFLCFALLIATLLVVAARWNYGWAKAASEREAREELDHEWALLKVYLRVVYDREADRATDDWYYDSDDPDETKVVNSIQETCLIADQNGRVLRESRISRDIGMSDTPRIKARMDEWLTSSGATTPSLTVKQSAQGIPFMVRAGIILSQDRRIPYYAAIAAPVSESRRSFFFFTCTLFCVIICGLLLGWLLGHIDQRQVT